LTIIEEFRALAHHLAWVSRGRGAIGGSEQTAVQHRRAGVPALRRNLRLIATPYWVLSLSLHETPDFPWENSLVKIKR